jgi:hypothetical protein
MGDRRADRTHAEGDDVERASAHAVLEQPLSRAFILRGSSQLLVGPASSSRSEQMKVRSSTRATSLGWERARKLLGRFSGFSRTKVPALDHLGAESVVLLLRTVAPVDTIGLAELGQLRHPVQEMTVLSTGLPVVPCGHAGLLHPRGFGGSLSPTSADARRGCWNPVTSTRKIGIDRGNQDAT